MTNFVVESLEVGAIGSDDPAEQRVEANVKLLELRNERTLGHEIGQRRDFGTFGQDTHLQQKKRNQR